MAPTPTAKDVAQAPASKVEAATTVSRGAVTERFPSELKLSQPRVSGLRQSGQNPGRETSRAPGWSGSAPERNLPGVSSRRGWRQGRAGRKRVVPVCGPRR